MTREQKLALIVGFSLILLVGVLISDHLSRARAAKVAEVEAEERGIAAASRPSLPEPVRPIVHEVAGAAPEPNPVQPPTQSESRTPAETTIAMGPAAARRGETDAATQPVGSLTDATRQLLDQLKSGAVSVMADGQGVQLPPATSLVPGGKAPPKAETTPKTQPPAKPSTTWYTVKQGETLFQIAKQRYGTGNAWKQIAELNKGRVSADGAVRAGEKIELYETLPGAAAVPRETAAPESAPKPPAKTPATTSGGEQRIASAEPKPRPSTYTVQRGDSLGVISQRVLGTVRRKDEILDLNKGVVDDEDSIQVGMVLKMPPR